MSVVVINCATGAVTSRDFTADEIAAREAIANAVPASVSRFQAKAALANAGLLADVETAIAASDAVTKLAWADATEFQRASPTIATMAAALNLTDEQVDDLFRTAKAISA